jgi:hypothetical protein
MTLPPSLDPTQRGVHVGDREVGQGPGVTRTGAAFMDAQRAIAGARLPTAALGVAAGSELDAEQPGPETPSALGIVGGKFDQGTRSIHALGR